MVGSDRIRELNSRPYREYVVEAGLKAKRLGRKVEIPMTGSFNDFDNKLLMEAGGCRDHGHKFRFIARDELQNNPAHGGLELITEVVHTKKSREIVFRLLIDPRNGQF